jgi:hypothetical protein
MCIYFSRDSKYVKVGAPNNVQRRRIVKAIPHEDYDPATKRNNIALFKLNASFDS